MTIFCTNPSDPLDSIFTIDAEFECVNSAYYSGVGYFYNYKVYIHNRHKEKVLVCNICEEDAAYCIYGDNFSFEISKPCTLEDIGKALKPIVRKLYHDR